MDTKLEFEFMENFNKLNSNFFMYKENEKIFLKSNIHKDWLPFSIDFLSNEISRRKSQISLNQEIAKAIGIKKDYKPRVLDTTAGLGRDSFMLASLGCEVVMLERNSVIFLLLKNGLNIASSIENTKEIIERMALINENSIDFLKNKLENFEANEINEKITHIITLRYFSDVKTDNRIKYGTRIFNIKGIINILEENKILEIKVEEIV